MKIDQQIYIDEEIRISEPSPKAKWIAALRSGKYKKCRRYLENDSGGVARYCALGVLLFKVDQDYYFEIEKNHPWLFYAVASMNDYGFSFKMIARFVERFA